MKVVVIVVVVVVVCGWMSNSGGRDEFWMVMGGERG